MATAKAVTVSATDLNILALDTVTEACSVALLARGTLEQRFEVAANRHSRRVLGMAQEVLRARGLALRDLDALAVDVGPGAFTGARIGIGVAQGLAYGADLTVIPVNSLEALAAAVLRPGHGGESGGDESGGGDGGDVGAADGVGDAAGGVGAGDGDATGGVGVGDGDAAGAGATLALPAIDARMEQVYFGLYSTAGALIEPALATPGDAGEMAFAAIAKTNAPANLTGIGSGWDRHAPALLTALENAPVLQESLHRTALQESLENAPAMQESLHRPALQESLSKAALEWLPGRHPEAANIARIAAARGLQHAVSPLHLRATYLRIDVAKPAKKPGHPP
ncbi:MAG: tRNA (adenosine(37)-N6)-threonylcarbamoyltransferase complex dimerization subunit type 1 TsaB [Gammaproteobacteria bacterium]|nr:tRNA (adenosine(37)-N6)-threonylcarbamoyltransferase complex dimerization subunit type 1 TsaB [Gammaproteobacteria bacterium]